MLSEKIQTKIHLADKRLNLLVGYEANNIKNYIDSFIKNGSIEVGYRSSCGTTHSTMKTFSEFYKVIKMLRKEGLEITEESVKHKNAYATNNGGFWNSTIFKIQKK